MSRALDANTSHSTRNFRQRRRVSQWAQEILGVVVAGLFLIPLVWMLLAALKDPSEVFTGTLLPEKWMWQNFVKAWNTAPFARYLLNSLFVSGTVTFVVLLTSSMAGFAFSRLHFPGRQWLFLIALGTLMIPGDVLLIPNFITMREFGWVNSYQALIVPFLASGFGVFLMRQAFMRTPVELEDAARIDGAKPAQFLFRILMPLNGPSLSALGVLTFLGTYNALVWPFIAASREEVRTVQVGLASFNNLEVLNLPVILAATTIVVAPVLIVYAFAQKWFIESAASSGLKG
ncbi:carbohydrate ABC transporter permease [Deinococcus peraridilitoris]|uniref:ABC-type sugar transport system, permease component n=1 Tax=Deinococcus peraridilitoris (strain DSM 19664 / LMG 22246 / CIP 109416 / KR-200) TaxID=937777 RepID=L0A1L5_DEIPD|nr:carbohydrate ABC transporter permease [Deinococcus peraridilitoris]AFZ66905.1 ABC-type sugar transport system, permease component [Deinococcus peraridilitoris DSM 19664]